MLLYEIPLGIAIYFSFSFFFFFYFYCVKLETSVTRSATCQWFPCPPPSARRWKERALGWFGICFFRRHLSIYSTISYGTKKSHGNLRVLNITPVWTAARNQQPWELKNRNFEHIEQRLHKKVQVQTGRHWSNFFSVFNEFQFTCLKWYLFHGLHIYTKQQNDYIGARQ